MGQYKVYRYSEYLGTTWATSRAKAINNVRFRRYGTTISNTGFKAIRID